MPLCQTKLKKRTTLDDVPPLGRPDMLAHSGTVSASKRRIVGFVDHERPTPLRIAIGIACWMLVLGAMVFAFVVA